MPLKNLGSRVNCLIPIQNGLGPRAVFCLPGAGGGLAGFLPLAEAIGAQVTLYGLLPFNPSASEAIRTVEAAADICALEILGAQRDGPYGLVGHSFGGWVAFETALRLRAMGKEVFPLLLLDTDPPGTSNQNRDRIGALLKFAEVLGMASGQHLELTRQNLKDRTHESQLELILGEMKRLRLLPTTARTSVIDDIVQTFECNLNTTYDPRSRLGVEMWLAQPTEEWQPAPRAEEDVEEELTPEQALAAWRKYAPEVRQIRVAGNHMSMLKQPNIAAVGQLLNRFLRDNRIRDSGRYA